MPLGDRHGADEILAVAHAPPPIAAPRGLSLKPAGRAWQSDFALRCCDEPWFAKFLADERTG
jgi:hypothetical protein